MFRPRIIPVLTLKGQGLVKTVKFNKKKARYIGDPINAVKIFNDLESDELVFLDITATLENRCVSTELVRQIGDEAYMPFAVGGGIQTLSQIKELISAGAEKVVINSQFSKKPELVSEAASVFGKQSIIVSIDIKQNIWKNHKIWVTCSNKRLKTDIIEYAKMAEEYGAGELIINSIDRDGTYTGYDYDIIKKICDKVNIPVIALGGASSLNDFYELTTRFKASAAAAGSLFVYHGPRKAVLVNYPDNKELKAIFSNED